MFYLTLLAETYFWREMFSKPIRKLFISMALMTLPFTADSAPLSTSVQRPVSPTETSDIVKVLLQDEDLSTDTRGNAEHSVALVDSEDLETGHTVRCVGVAVATDVVLTAGHCLMRVRNVQVKFVSNLSPIEFETSRAKSFRAHPLSNGGDNGEMYDEFNDGNSFQYHDIGVILLEKSSSIAVPITLTPPDLIPENLQDSRFFVFGRSQDFQTRKRTGRIGFARVLEPKPLKAGPNYYKAMLDVNPPSPPQAVCQGDSGGPVTISAEDEYIRGRNVHYLMGIFVSQHKRMKLADEAAAAKVFGSVGNIPACGMGIYYVNVHTELAWIERTLEELDPQTPRTLNVFGRDDLAATRVDAPAASTPTGETGVDQSEEGLIAITHSPPEQLNPDYKKYPNFDLTGAALDKRPARSTELCETKCTATSGCKAYTFDSWNKICYLKGEIGNLMLNGRARSGVNTTFELPTQSNVRIAYEYFNGKAFPGRGYDTRKASTRDTCKATCASDGRCIGFNFIKSQQLCELFDTVGEYSSKSGYQSGAKVQE